MSNELKVAIAAAKTGAKTALKYFDKELDLGITLKENKSILTKADLDTEKQIIKFIKSKYPDANILAEESGGHTDHSEFWIIDPIDATRVFAKGIAQWSILIAYYKNNTVQVGVCYIPTQNMLVYAERGKGAYLNGKRIHVSGTRKLEHAFASFGGITHFKKPELILKLGKKGANLRSYEHAYTFSFVASGKMDFVIDSFATPWDYAPLVRIIEEAGGQVSDFEGKPWSLGSKNLIVSNGILHNEILKTINS